MSLIMDIIVWPPRAVLSLLSSLFRLALYICLLPFRIIANIGRSLWFKVCALFQYSEHKLVLLKTCKPICYLFTEGGAPDTIKSKEQAEEEEEESDKTVYQRRVSRSSSPAESDEGQSIASLIQDLVKLSQTETKPQDKVKGRVQQEKIQLLLQEIQELAAAGGITNSEDEVGEDVGVSGGGARVKVLLEDLGSLETYLNQFICEEEEETHPPPLPPDRSGLLETIIEETASKESSPLHCRSPIPQRLKRSALPTSHETISEERELTHSQNEISQTLLLLQKVTQSQELKETLQQLSDMHKQSEGACQTPPTSIVPAGSDEKKATATSDRERRESLKNQLDSSQLEMDSIISSLDQHQKFMSSQKELQEAMDSLNVHTTDEKSSSKATPPKSKPGPKSASSSKQVTPPETEQIYDSLSAASPVYSNVVKKPRPPPPTHNPQESIYDSIKPVSVATVTDETPPPIPLRRTLSDVSTDSCENSPIFRRRRGSIGDEDRECCHGNHRRRHSNGKHHGRKHSSSTSSSHSNCRHCNHTQERSRSGDYYRGGYPSDDSQDDDDDDDDEVCVMSDRRRHESGYESHQDSPTLTRRVRGRHNSDGNWGPMTPPTPRDSKRGFFGLFSKKSTSLTSLNSTKSDVSERGSVSSYKL